MKYNAGSLWGSIEAAAAGEAHPTWFEIRPQTDVNGNINGAIQLQEDCFFFGGFVQNGSSFFTRGGDAFHGDGSWGDYTGTAVDNTLAIHQASGSRACMPNRTATVEPGSAPTNRPSR